MIKKVSVVLAFSLFLIVCWHLLKKEPQATTSPKQGTVIQAVYATGEVEPVQWSKISTQLTGKVEEIHVKEGDKISKNTPLAKLDDSVECTKASQYLANLRFLEKETERYKALADKDYSSKSKYQRILSEYQAAKAQLDAQNEVVGRMLIKSPLDGIVLKRDVEPGEIITPSDIIFWVGNNDSLRVTAEVDEEDIALVKKGQTALIKADAFPDRTIKGTISDITPKGDPVDKNFRVRVSLPEDTPLFIGMTVEINIVAKTIDDALIIPASSLFDNTVWVKEGKKFKERVVQTGITNDEKVQILDGLAQIDIILLDVSDKKK